MARPTKRQPRVRAELLDKMPPLQGPGPLETVGDLQLEWQRIHRSHFRGQLMPGEYNQLNFGLQTGMQLTRVRDELKNAQEELQRLARIEIELAAIKGGRPGIEYLPAASGESSIPAMPVERGEGTS
jgi:hypothetical protein